VLTVNGIRDQTPAQRLIASNSVAPFLSARRRGAIYNVAEAAQYTLVYSLDIPNAPNYFNGAPYNNDNRLSISNFSRVAYYLELRFGTGPLEYLWVSMNPFTNHVNGIGVPTRPSSAVFQRPVVSMNVSSSVAGLPSGNGLTGGYMEFWPSNYSETNSAGVPNASNATFDWGDTMAAGLAGNYGSMQVHSASSSRVLFAFNNWGGNGGMADIGIGNQPSGHPDWTFAGNAPAYSIKTLQVYALAPRPPFQILQHGFTTTNTFAVTGSTRPGTTYSLWRNTNLASTNWIPIAQALASGTNLIFTDTAVTNGTAFYQIRIP
jgi:hypothetical protein